MTDYTDDDIVDLAPGELLAGLSERLRGVPYLTPEEMAARLARAVQGPAVPLRRLGVTVSRRDRRRYVWWERLARAGDRVAAFARRRAQAPILTAADMNTEAPTFTRLRRHEEGTL